MLTFEVEARDGEARAGVLHTAHGDVPTPAFMPVGTQASVKSLAPSEVAAPGTRMLIANTYHLWLRPGPEVVAEQGGLHEFMRWPHAIVTDSGGFQAFSLAERTQVSVDGFEISSHLDGSRRMLSPEESMRVQGLLGSDIAMQLDVCPPAGVGEAELDRAIELTTRWAERCLAARRPGQALFGIVQGGTDVERRLAHARVLGSYAELDGLALGGFSVGEPPTRMHQALGQVAPALDAARPRYLMGVGTPQDLAHAIGAGVDLFDCVIPTRNARNGTVYVPGGRLNIRNARHARDGAPLQTDCECATCSGRYSRAYLRHLYIAGEILAHRLLTVHNLHFYARWVAGARRAIQRGAFADWRAGALAVGEAGARGSQGQGMSEA